MRERVLSFVKFFLVDNGKTLYSVAKFCFHRLMPDQNTARDTLEPQYRPSEQMGCSRHIILHSHYRLLKPTLHSSL